MVSLDQILLTFDLDCDSTLALLQVCLHKQGFRCMHSFELTSACASFSDPTCPHHPGQSCECSLVTLTAYRYDIGVIPLVLHGHADKTEISNGSTRLLPTALMDCLKQTHHEEQVLKNRLFRLEQA